MFKLMLNCLEISASATRLANNEGLPANMASFLHVCMFDQHGLKRNLNKKLHKSGGGWWCLNANLVFCFGPIIFP